MSSWAQKTDENSAGRASALSQKGRSSAMVILEDNPEGAMMVGGRSHSKVEKIQSARGQSSQVDGNERKDEERPDSSKSKVSFASDVKNGETEKLTDQDAMHTEEARKKKEKREKLKKGLKSVFKWTKLGIYFVVLLGVVVLCLISAAISFMKFMQTSGEPASTYKPKKMSGPHEEPGLMFIGIELDLISCDRFNFTNLDVSALSKEPSCDPLSFTLSPSDSLSSDTLSKLPDFFKLEKERGNTLNMHLTRGPSDWENNEAVKLHLTVPKRYTGTWMMLHQRYKDAYSEFDAAIAGSADARWNLAANLILGYSLNFVATDSQSFFLMSKQDFMDMGVIQSSRIDMEISILFQNTSQTNAVVGVDEVNSTIAHIEAIYQWKDGYYMVGDTFLATSPFQIVTVISGALLMFERAYNTFLRLYNSAKRKPKPKAEDEKKEEEGKESGENQSDAASGDQWEDDVSPRGDSRMDTPTIRVDDSDNFDDFGNDSANLKNNQYNFDD